MGAGQAVSTVTADVDVVLGFTLPGRSARGRLVRAGAVLDAILAAHDYPEPMARLLADALVLTALIGATLRGDEGQTTVQAQGSGGLVDLLVCDYLGGRVRGYLRLADGVAADAVRPGLSLNTLFGEGYLAVTLDQSAVDERYQGIVPLAGANLASAIETILRCPSRSRRWCASRPTPARRAGSRAGCCCSTCLAGKRGRSGCMSKTRWPVIPTGSMWRPWRRPSVQPS